MSCRSAASQTTPANSWIIIWIQRLQLLLHLVIAACLWVSERSLLVRPLFAASVCKIRWQGCLFPAVLFSRHRRSLLTGQSGTEQWCTIKNRFWMSLTSGLLHSFVQTDCKKPPPPKKKKKRTIKHYMIMLLFSRDFAHVILDDCISMTNHT